ncbi:MULTISPECIES: beta/gamma crystallin domain-containing protein [unclassified Streptomyces]|nr:MULTISPECIES: beta/gamma crystallin domain-containing protein [unclassified Streptomyces]MDN3270870.1 beta/gamma crystallin domain-containing protein [Streptomyces sp. MA15]
MKRSLKRVIVGALATGALTAALPAGSAAAINGTPCGDRTDLVKVTYFEGLAMTCFANAGVMDLTLPYVTQVSSGNNNIRFVSDGETISMGKWQKKSIVDGTPKTITRLRIL